VSDHDELFARPYDRRGVLVAGGAALLAAAYGSRAGSALAALSEAEASGTLFYYNWAAYTNPKTFPAFTKATTVKVKKDFYPSNEALLAKLKAGARGYDLISPTGYMVEILIAEKLLQPLDWSKLGTVKRNIDRKYLNLPYDPKNRYSVPKDWGTTGIVYRTDLIKERPTTWREFVQLAKTKYSGKVTVVDSGPAVIGSFAKMLGYDFNTASERQLDEVRRELLDLKPHLLAIDSSDNRTVPLIRGRAVMGLAWNGDGLIVAGKKPAKYVIPKEGGEFWMDTYAIPVGAKNVEAAYAWMNFVYRPRINKLETEFNLYGSPVKLSLLRGVVNRKVLNDPAIFPPASVARKLQAIDPTPTLKRAHDRIWKEFKAR
jgi:spermidine/putrescine transport system substrate-binding protein